MSKHYSYKKRRCGSYKCGGYCPEVGCKKPYVVLPNSAKCNDYSFPDCSMNCCDDTTECDNDLDYIADDNKFPCSFEPYLRRECTRDTPEDCDYKPCCKKKHKGPKRYSCCGGKPYKPYSESDCSDYKKHEHKEYDCKDKKYEHDYKHKKHHKNGWVSACEEKEHITSCSSEESGMKRSFNVTLVPKALHPQAHRIPNGAYVWAVNGYPGPRINLRKGNVYYFTVSQPEGPNQQEFFLTTDIVGGRMFPELQLPGTTSVVNGTIALKVDDYTPKCFYYQSKSGDFRGGSITVSA